MTLPILAQPAKGTRMAAFRNAETELTAQYGQPVHNLDYGMLALDRIVIQSPQYRTRSVTSELTQMRQNLERRHKVIDFRGESYVRSTDLVEVAKGIGVHTNVNIIEARIETLYREFSRTTN